MTATAERLPASTGALAIPAAGGRHERVPAAVVLLTFLVAAVVVVPVATPALVSDEWLYARSVDDLVTHGALRVSDLSVATLVFQILWGGLFTVVLGHSFLALRLSTVTLFMLSGVAFYALLLQLGVSPRRAALGLAAYLFNPLSFALALSFMSDAPFLALLVIATACYVRGLAHDGSSRRWVLAGALACACGALVRHHALLVPAAVVAWLLLTRRVERSAKGAGLLAAVAALPVAATVAYYTWLMVGDGVPYGQRLFIEEVGGTGLGGALELGSRLGFTELMFIGFFALPVAVAAATSLPAVVGGLRRRHRLVAAAWLSALVVGLVIFIGEGRPWPYVGQFVRAAGLGPDDLLVGRRPLLGTAGLYVVTAVCALASAVVALVLGRLGRAEARHPSAISLVLVIAVTQAVAVVLPSFHTWAWDRAITFDRYLLPLLPFAICLPLVALRGLRLRLLPAGVVVALLAVVSTAGTRDALVFHRAVWDVGNEAHRAGVARDRIDAGAAWDGYHLSDGSFEHRAPTRTPNPPWWVDYFAPATDSSYVVAGGPVPGYDVVRRVQRRGWLARDEMSVFLLRRQSVAGPP